MSTCTYWGFSLAPYRDYFVTKMCFPFTPEESVFLDSNLRVSTYFFFLYFRVWPDLCLPHLPSTLTSSKRVCYLSVGIPENVRCLSLTATCFFREYSFEPDVVALVCKHSICQAIVGGSSWIWGQPGLQNETLSQPCSSPKDEVSSNSDLRHLMIV